MRSYLSLCGLLLIAGSVLSVAGCSDVGNDGPMSRDESLAKIEKAQKDAELKATASQTPSG